MILWNDRTSEFRSSCTKIDSKCLLGKRKKGKMNPIIVELKDLVLPSMTKIQKSIENQREIYLYSMSENQRNSFESNCEDTIKNSTSLVKSYEAALERHFQQTSYSISKSDHYRQVIKLVKTYCQNILKSWLELKENYSDIKETLRQAKTLDENPLKTIEINYSDSDEDNQSETIKREQETMLLEFQSQRKQMTEITKTVTDIAKMQEQLTEQVILQNDTVELVEDNVEKTTQNVVNGNEQLRKAIQNSASTRAAIIFFLFMSSILLLLLDYVS